MPVDSLLDTDLYKLTMQACVHKHFRDAEVQYKLVNRNRDTRFSAEAVEWIREQIAGWAALRFSADELEFLHRELAYLPPAYFAFLEHEFRLDPAKEVAIHFDGGAQFSIEVSGSWATTIWYEVPILATVSEAFFRFVETDWTLDGQEELAATKARELVANQCLFSEFGTRRRRSKETQEIVVRAIAEAVGKSPMFAGTSNVHFARINGLKPIGTVAHELMMGIAAYTNRYVDANTLAMEYWIDTVGEQHAGVALTDTFGTPLFLERFTPPFSDIYVGVRQDSGDPAQFADLISAHYAKLGVPPGTKRIVYSDALTVEKCVALRESTLPKGLIPAFGIGTFFSNDFRRASRPTEKSHPLNIVMKIANVNGRAAVKLSDNRGKNTGDPEEVRRAKAQLGYNELAENIDESRRWS